jgi:hypothetical protein
VQLTGGRRLPPPVPQLSVPAPRATRPRCGVGGHHGCARRPIYLDGVEQKRDSETTGECRKCDDDFPVARQPRDCGQRVIMGRSLDSHS